MRPNDIGRCFIETAGQNAQEARRLSHAFVSPAMRRREAEVLGTTGKPYHSGIPAGGNHACDRDTVRVAIFLTISEGSSLCAAVRPRQWRGTTKPATKRRRAVEKTVVISMPNVERGGFPSSAPVIRMAYA